MIFNLIKLIAGFILSQRAFSNLWMDMYEFLPFSYKFIGIVVPCAIGFILSTIMKKNCKNAIVSIILQIIALVIGIMVVVFLIVIQQQENLL